MMRHSSFRGRPPWWPEGETWPPVDAQGRHYWHRRRRRFVRRAGLVVGALVLLSVLGFASLISLIADRAGFPGVSAITAVLLLAPFVIVVVFIGVMRRLGAPVGDIVTAANQVAAGDFSVRVRETGPPFLRAVAAAFNTMTTRLQTQDDQRRQLMADVAHELRTPLTVMQGRLEGMVDGVYQRDDAQVRLVLEDTRTLSRLVEDLRTLANAEAGALVLQPEPTDLPVLLSDLAASFRLQAEGQSVALTWNVAPQVPLVSLDPARIREVLTNLVANALQHTPVHGRVSVLAEQAADRIVIRVADTGSGIEAGDLPKVFNRFYKGPESRGSGLGLAIARKLTLAHGGDITATSEPGVGTTMTVSLPLGPPSSARP
jgi:signal transduction histidine kinase